MIAIAPTDTDWFDFLRNRPDLSTINFWTPTPWNPKQLEPGHLFYFLLKAPIRKVGGWGIFVRYENLTARDAWAKYGEGNGVTTSEELLRRVGVRAFYRGQIGLYCEYDEFSTDTPLNRVLKAAARGVILRRNEFRAPVRKRAAAVVARMEDVGRLQHADLRAQLERRTTHYREAVALARNLLQWEGRFLEHGAAVAWTFLIRTPEMVEAGLRNVVADAIGSVVEVRSGKRKLKGSKLTFNPDLVFGDTAAVGDVKYKLVGADWNRSDLYQLIAFSVFYDVPLGLLVGFVRPKKPMPVDVKVAGTDLRVVPWPADSELSPKEAAAELVHSISQHLKPYVPGLGQLDLKLTA